MKRALPIALISLLVIAMFAAACGNGTDSSSHSTDSSSQVTSLSWPKDSLAPYVPELKGITITSIEDTESGIEIVFTGCDSDKTKRYIGSLKGEGWTVETDNQDAGKTVTASMQSEVVVFFSSPDGSGFLTYQGAD